MASALPKHNPAILSREATHGFAETVWHYLKNREPPSILEFLVQKRASIHRSRRIIKGRPAPEGGSDVWCQRCSVSLHCNRKTERSGCVMRRECWVVSSGRGFAPAPPGFSALVPVPMRGLYPHVIKKGCSGIPPRSVEATESALGLLPSRALSSAQFALIITAARRRMRPLWGELEYGTLPWGKDPRWHESPSPQGGNST
jgi:hypothetical protein